MHSIIITYAILKHQLLEINIVIKRSIVYSFLITLISLFYLIAVVCIEKFLENFFHYQSPFISIILAFGLGILFVPLKGKIQALVDRIFLHRTHQEIEQENILLRHEVAHTEKLKAVSTLASGLAHEVKNPLTAIRTFSEYLPQKLEDKEFLNKFSKIVGSEVNRVNDLVNQLLAFSKPSPPELKETDICKLMTETLNFLNSKFVKNKITAKTDFAPDPEILLKLDHAR